MILWMEEVYRHHGDKNLALLVFYGTECSRITTSTLGAEKEKPSAIRDFIMNRLVNMDAWPQPPYEEILARNRSYQVRTKKDKQ